MNSIHKTADPPGLEPLPIANQGCGPENANRQDNVPDCVALTPQRLRRLHWLPETCGYRLVAEGRDLAWWHPLVSGDPESVHEAGISMRGRAVPEDPSQDLEEFVIQWVRPGGRIRRSPVRRYDEDCPGRAR